MRRSAAFRSVALATLLLFSISCVSTNLAPISSQGKAFQPLLDEKKLWRESRAEEGTLLDKVRPYHDPDLEVYLEEVVERLNPRAMADNPDVRYKVRVIEDPTLNAFAYPHGSIYIHTGLLARMENEDELATVLGHEMTHVENRHMLRYQRSAHNKEVGFTVAAIAAYVAVAAVAGNAADKGNWGQAEALDAFGQVLVGLGLQLAFLASVSGYGRGLEEEADQGGFAKLSAAGYDLRQAPKVYQVLYDDLGDSRKAEAFFFGSHPRLTERIDVTKRYVAAHAGSAPMAADRAERDTAFARAIRPVVRDDARLNIDMGRLTLAESELKKVRDWMPEDPETHFLKGRLRMAQAATEKGSEGQERLLNDAETSFRKSIELDGASPAPHRELGMLLHDRQDFRGACVQLRRYAQLDPEAEDMDHVDELLAEMGKAGACG
jgi:predicted Zn-dependent protease